jgi:hypothetical protein
MFDRIHRTSISFHYISLSKTTMPRRKCCQHPTRHANSAFGAKGEIPVCSQLSQFLINRYDLMDIRIRWLCQNSHTLETKEMKSHQSMETTDSSSSSDNESIAEKTNTDDDDSNHEETGYDNQKDEGHSYMETDTEDGPMSDNDDDEDDSHVNNDDHESMDDESDDVLHHVAYQQNEAMDKLSIIFQLFNIAPIHDK